MLNSKLKNSPFPDLAYQWRGVAAEWRESATVLGWLGGTAAAEPLRAVTSPGCAVYKDGRDKDNDRNRDHNRDRHHKRRNREPSHDYTSSFLGYGLICAG